VAKKRGVNELHSKSYGVTKKVWGGHQKEKPDAEESLTGWKRVNLQNWTSGMMKKRLGETNPESKVKERETEKPQVCSQKATP